MSYFNNCTVGGSSDIALKACPGRLMTRQVLPCCCGTACKFQVRCLPMGCLHAFIMRHELEWIGPLSGAVGPICRALQAEHAAGSPQSGQQSGHAVLVQAPCHQSGHCPDAEGF